MPSATAPLEAALDQPVQTRRPRPVAADGGGSHRHCRTGRCGRLRFAGEAGALRRRFRGKVARGGIKEFHVWTVDDPEVARFYHRLGAWGITTNRPQFIREQLEGK